MMRDYTFIFITIVIVAMVTGFFYMAMISMTTPTHAEACEDYGGRYITGRLPLCGTVDGSALLMSMDCEGFFNNKCTISFHTLATTETLP